MILKTVVDRLFSFGKLYGANLPAFDKPHRLTEPATHPLARPAKRLVLSLLLAYPGRLRRRFAPATRLNALAGASNYSL